MALIHIHILHILYCIQKTTIGGQQKSAFALNGTATPYINITISKYHVTCGTYNSVEFVTNVNR